VSDSADMARAAADSHAAGFRAALELVGGVPFPSRRKHRCPVCADTGELLDDDGLLVEFCDCETGEALRVRGWLA
jgi:hypothetical protein